MDAPSQPFPPWLTPVPSVFTDADGLPMTSTSIEFLPLTYLGPSIPLGSLYTFGGSTEPATIVTGTPTSTATATDTATPTPTPSTTSSTEAIPSTSTSEISSSSISSISSTSSSSISLSSSSSTTISSTSFSTTTSPSASATIVPGPASVSGLSKGQLIGVIVASILGFIFLLVFILALYLWCKGRPNRQSRTRFSMITPIDQDYFVVPAGGHTPGEGSPRHSGEEADPFLQRSRSGRPVRSGAAGAGVKLVTAGAGEMGNLPPRTAARVPPPPVVAGTQNSSDSNSSYGTMLATRVSMFPEPPTHLGDKEQEIDDEEKVDMTGARGRILTPEEQRHIESQHLSRTSFEDPKHSDEDDDLNVHTALLPPPRLVDPEIASYKPTPSLRPFGSHHSLEEDVTLLTARRVKVENLGPRTTPQRSPLREIPPEMGGAPPRSGGLLGSLGLGSLRPLSWLRNFDSPRNSTHAPSSFTPVPLSDNDLEIGRSQLGSEKGDSGNSNSRLRAFGVGFGADGSRPMSGVSAKSTASGGTIYHDAHSSVPSTPGTPRLVPPPRVHTPAEIPPVPVVPVETRWPSTTTMAVAPPAYALDAPSRQGSTSNMTENPPPSFDVLDMPAPAAITNFISASSLRDTASGSTVGVRSTPFPPGLELISSKAWSEMSMSAVSEPSPNSFAVMPASDNEAGIAIDVLEEAPPSAGDGWRALAAGAVGRGSNRRATLGTPLVVYPQDHISQQGSLHSMRSNTSAPRSTGSAPAIRDGSLSSGSHSQGHSGSSGYSAVSAHSLGRTGSVTSDGRRRGPISPSYSAFGQRSARVSAVAGGFSDSEFLETPPPTAHLGHERERGSTFRSAGSGSSGPELSIM